MSDSKAKRPANRGSLSRRHFFRLTTATAGLIAASPWRVHLAQSAGLPTPDTSGIEHIIVVMMENRSFDHFLGWVPGADGKQAGLSYTDATGASHATYPLAPDYQGCAHPDPDHSYEGGRIELNNGACDGWLRAGKNDRYAIGYYTAADLPFFAGAAQHWTILDRYFSAIMAPNITVPSFNVPQGPFGEVCPPDLTLSLKDRDLVLSWVKGKGLETATSIYGPWSSVTNAISPFTVQIADAARFFRSPNKWIGLSALAKEAGFFN